MEVRLGGIYALEQIAKTSPGYATPIADVCLAYIRSRAARGPDTEPADRWRVLKQSMPDIQATLEILFFRELWESANLGQLNLSSTNLSYVKLAGLHLIDANLARIDLTGTDLYGADLSGCDLSEAGLSEANLERGMLKSAGRLARAHLSVLICHALR